MMLSKYRQRLCIYVRYLASLSCAIHCIITPFLIISSPVIGSKLANPVIEIFLLLFSILLCLSIIFSGYNKHKKAYPMYLSALGICLWIINFYREFNGLESSIYYSIIGSFFIVSAYIINHYFLKQLMCKTFKHS